MRCGPRSGLGPGEAPEAGPCEIPRQGVLDYGAGLIDLLMTQWSSATDSAGECGLTVLGALAGLSTTTTLTVA